MAAFTKEDVVKYIEGMTVLELAELVKELEAKFGVSAAAPLAVAAAAPAAGGVSCRSSGSIASPEHSASARSRMFSSSRTLPGN